MSIFGVRDFMQRDTKVRRRFATQRFAVVCLVYNRRWQCCVKSALGRITTQRFAALCRRLCGPPQGHHCPLLTAPASRRSPLLCPLPPLPTCAARSLTSIALAWPRCKSPSNFLFLSAPFAICSRSGATYPTCPTDPIFRRAPSAAAARWPQLACRSSSLAWTCGVPIPAGAPDASA
jgi:hypothetical protein